MKKGAVTIFEIALLAVLATVLVITYQVFAQTVTENIVLRTADSARNQECSMALFTVYSKDYKRAPTRFENDGDYADLQEFYDLASVYEPDNLYEDSLGIEVFEGTRPNSECLIYSFDPVNLYQRDLGYGWLSAK